MCIRDRGDTVEAYLNQFREWLLSPTVVSEFRLLIAPREGRDIDVSLLREELEATGLEVEHLGFDFDEMVRGMVGAFFTETAGEPELEGMLQSGLLAIMVNRMDSLQTLARFQNASTQQAVTELEQIRQLASAISDGTGDTTALLKEIRDLLAQPDQHYGTIACLLYTSDAADE